MLNILCCKLPYFRRMIVLKLSLFLPARFCEGYRLMGAIPLFDFAFFCVKGRTRSAGKEQQGF